MNDLVSFWNEINLENAPFIHPKDQRLIKEHYTAHLTYEEFVTRRLLGQPDSFHLHLLPIPYVGDIANAKIYFLLLNPGYSIMDSYVEQTSKSLRNELKNNLKQENLDPDFPFLFLNPRYAWHPGFEYWIRRLKNQILKVNNLKKTTVIESLSYISKRIAVLELVPYHSPSFNNVKLIETLASTDVLKGFVRNVLLPKANADKACIICIRKIREWNLPDHHKNIVKFKSSESRGGFISSEYVSSKIEQYLKL